MLVASEIGHGLFFMFACLHRVAVKVKCDHPQNAQRYTHYRLQRLFRQRNDGRVGETEPDQCVERWESPKHLSSQQGDNSQKDQNTDYGNEDVSDDETCNAQKTKSHKDQHEHEHNWHKVGRSKIRNGFLPVSRRAIHSLFHLQNHFRKFLALYNDAMMGRKRQLQHHT